VAANGGGDRVGTVTVADQTFTVSQVGAPCTFTVSPAGQSVGGGAASTTFTVSTASYCSWTASVNDAWLSVSSGSSGTGSGTVTLAAAANSGPARTGSGTIAGQAVTVSQAAAPCMPAISPAAQNVGADGGTASTTLTLGNWCSWTAASNASWITLTSASSGSGSATMSVSVAANTGPARSGTATIAGQPFTVWQAAPGLPVGWTHQDIGAVGVAGSAGFDGTTFSIAGGGADVWGSADALHFAYQPLTGDGRIVARVATVQNTNAWVKAGVMFRETTDPGSPHAFMLESFSKGLAFQRRPTANGTSVSSSGALSAAPYWVRLDRIGNTFTAYQSPDGVMWTIVGAETIPMTATVLVGVGVSSHTTAATATATFDNVTVVSGAPPAWTHQDIGAVGAAGTATYAPSTSVFSVKGGGADIWGTADAFHYAYQTMSGDGALVARVASVQNVNAWTKAGVMIRETLAPGSANALMLVSWSKGLSFQRRQTAGGPTVSTAGALGGAPYWVKLERVGNTFNAYSSPDGATWTLVGSDTVAMGTTVYVGLAVSSHTTSAAAQATFDAVLRQ
jgi:regulation of enolase protein 1 (concanavalin A-like superfamily)